MSSDFRGEFVITIK